MLPPYVCVFTSWQYSRSLTLGTGQREAILQELVLRLVKSGQHRRAKEELELYAELSLSLLSVSDISDPCVDRYLPSQPYQDNPSLHLYAGLICIYLAQPFADRATWDEALLREAQQHLARATLLDPADVVAKSWLDKVWRDTHFPKRLNITC